MARSRAVRASLQPSGVRTKNGCAEVGHRCGAGAAHEIWRAGLPVRSGTRAPRVIWTSSRSLLTQSNRFARPRVTHRGLSSMPGVEATARTIEDLLNNDGFIGLARNGTLHELEALFAELHCNQLEQVSGKPDTAKLKSSGASSTPEASSVNGACPRTCRNRGSDPVTIIRASAHRPRVHAPRGTRRDEWQPRPANGGRGTPP
jgi:hypothetical protein